METDMTKGNPLSVILKFTLPVLIGNIFQQLYNMADTVIVGRFVGANALAAVGSTGNIMFLVLGMAQGMSTGFTVLTSQKYGAGDKKAVRESVSNGIILSIFVTAVLTALSLILMRGILTVMNTPADIFEDAYSYIMIICIGIFASVFYNLFASYLRAVGNSRVPLFFLVFSACLNVGLDLLFVIVFRMGVAGAAWATVISQAVSAALCAVYIAVKVPLLMPEKGEWKLKPSLSRHQLAVGIPMALQFGITASGTMIMQSAVNLFGSTAVAALTAAGKIQNIVTQGMVSLGQTMATYAGQNYGKREIRRIRAGVTTALKIDVVYSLLGSAVVVLALPHLLGLFFGGGTSVPELLPWAQTYMRLCAAFYIPLSTIFVFRNTMQGCGYGFLPMMGGVSELAARLLTALLAIRLHSFPLACACDPAAFTTAALFTGISYCFVMKDIRKKTGGQKA